MTTEDLLSLLTCPALRYSGRDGTISRGHVRLADGHSFSAQAAATCWCEPRDDEGPYTAIELGALSFSPDGLSEYEQDETETLGMLYGYVPIEIVRDLIEAHGGPAPDLTREDILVDYETVAERYARSVAA